MQRIIKQFEDSAILMFDSGRFDDWCVYLSEHNVKRAPKDVEYFAALRTHAETYGNEKIYSDFVKVYDSTDSSLSNNTLALIAQLANQYENDRIAIDKLFTILYAGMVAEENKKSAILKKRIKRLGMHQVLMEGVSPEVAANFSKGRPWRDIDKDCKTRGF